MKDHVSLKLSSVKKDGLLSIASQLSIPILPKINSSAIITLIDSTVKLENMTIMICVGKENLVTGPDMNEIALQKLEESKLNCIRSTGLDEDEFTKNKFLYIASEYLSKAVFNKFERIFSGSHY